MSGEDPRCKMCWRYWYDAILLPLYGVMIAGILLLVMLYL